ncbi:RDD family protein [Aquibacillus halophilus]|uniref:RDD family protein n=1 Tax=Aquibacillus halophilus TaxID=930132 RepID=A0A6A8D6N0_9BACI|nr:RDD family protein [Aquibacillus halophilus]MRH41403.1 RDD family protein [Aquibacillus halophilus]
MSEEHVDYAQAPFTNRRYAGFWMRFWAYLVDLIIVFSINGILLIPFKFINDGASLDIGFWTVTGILGSIVLYLYFLFMTKRFNQTLGKMIFGLKVIREDAEPLKWSDLLFREVVGRFIHRVLFFTIFLYIVVAFTAEKQGIHDMFGNTRVVFDE